jgi:rsbT co-antagonist protein RsbR
MEEKIVQEARMLRAAPFAAVALDPTLRVVAWNQAAARMFGAGEAEALGAVVTALIPAVDEDFWRRLIADGGPGTTTTRAADGAELVCEWTAVHDRDADGQVIAVACYANDVTARTARESQSALEGTMLRAIIGNLNIIVWTMEKDGRCTYHQGKGLASIGQPQHALVGQNIRELYRDLDDSPLDRVFEGRLEFSNTEVHGAFFENWMIPMRNDAGEVDLMLALSLNVTEQRRGEQVLREKLAEIEAQQQTIRALSTPIVEVWDRVLTLPIIGIVDSARAAEIMDNLLQAVTSTRARFAILDMTGVQEIDDGTASHLLGLIRAIRLLGAEGVITGIHPNIAQTIVDLGVDLAGLVVRASLREALKHCIARLAEIEARRRK